MESLEKSTGVSFLEELNKKGEFATNKDKFGTFTTNKDKFGTFSSPPTPLLFPYLPTNVNLLLLFFLGVL